MSDYNAVREANSDPFRADFTFCAGPASSPLTLLIEDF